MSVFLTGFPGFLGAALVERLTDRTDRVDCLVQPKYLDAARRRAADIAGGGTTVDCHAGDITEQDLGLDAGTWTALTDRVEEVFHLAAVYDLGVDAELAEAVNVDGTDHVLGFARACSPDRFQYVSTCYVSGRYDGVFGPDDLDVDQSFTNHYEATKFRAEEAVRAAMAEGLPTTIYRPAIVVGDSETGETDKFDGPYSLVRMLDRQPRVALVPRFRGWTRHELNLVPREYVVDAIDHLSALDRSADTVYQLCDPNPSTVAEATRSFAAACDRRPVPVPASQRLVRHALGLSGMERLTGVDPDTVPYFTHPTRYVCPNATRDLAGTDISVPPLGTYVDRLVAYWRDNPDGRTGAMV